MPQLQHLLGADVFAASGFIDDIYVATFPAHRTGQSIARALDAFDPGQLAWPMIARQQTPRSTPNDPQFPNEWHLSNTGQGGGTVGADANITSAWDSYLGDGVVIGVVDDGTTPTHEDLAPNDSATLSWDFNHNDPVPSDGSHGTSVSGVALARQNNAKGVSGTAPNATLAGLELINGNTTDALEAGALSWMNDDIDIYNNSWGPADDGFTLEGPGPLTLTAWADSAANGRDGKGNIWVWAGGNGGNNGDNVNFDGYANNRYIIAVGALTNSGSRSSYSERGAPLLVSAYSNGGTLGITTTSASGYTNSFGGTSSASPLTAGVIALMLQANPSLTWRDVQHILVNGAEKVSPANSEWIVNGAGHHVNYNFGFGGIDAQAAVDLAAAWTNVGPELSATTGTIDVNQPIPNVNPTGLTPHRRCHRPDQARIGRGRVRRLAHGPRESAGDPHRTQRHRIGPGAQHSDTGNNYNDWVFTTKRDWDEDARGTWTIKVIDATGTADSGTWNSFKLNFYGTAISHRAGGQRIALRVRRAGLNGAARRTSSSTRSTRMSAEASMRPTCCWSITRTASRFPPTTFTLITQQDQTRRPSRSPAIPAASCPMETIPSTLLGAGVTNPSGTPMSGNVVGGFFVLQADANHDMHVNLLDFNLLAANFNGTGRIYSQGDFNYDGTVNLADFNILAGKFNTALSTTPVSPPPRFRSPAPTPQLAPPAIASSIPC